MRRTDTEKLYVVRKYVKAENVAAAIRKEKHTAPHEVFVDEAWKEKSLAQAIGFQVAAQRHD